MLCKIADSAQPAEPVAWRDLTANASPLSSQHRSAETHLLGRGHAPASPASSASPARGAAEMEQLLSELDRARQLEVAQARQAGLDAGLQQGREEAAGEVQNALDRVAHTLQELAKQKSQIRVEAEREIVKLSLAIARRILYRELSTDPESIEGIVHAALQKLQKRDISRVRVYPGGAAVVRAALDRIGNTAVIEVVADIALPIGALLFETSQGELDASVDTQLQEIQRGFADRLGAR